MANTPTPEPPSLGDQLSTLARHIATLDKDGRGIPASDIVDSLYPLRIGDGLEDVRQAIALLTHTDHGRAPAPIRLGAVLGRYKGRPLPGGICLARGAYEVGMTRWTTGAAASPVPTVAAVPEEVAPAPAAATVHTYSKLLVDDEPHARVRIEMSVGQWLADHCDKLPHTPKSLVVLAGSTAHPQDFTAASSDMTPRVCVVYTKFTSLLGGRLALPARVWESLSILRQRQQLDVYVCFCSEFPANVTFDRYDKYAWPPPGATPKAVKSMLTWPEELGTVVADFREITPNLQTLLQLGGGIAAPSAPPLTRFETMLLQQDRDLAAAVERGWLLTGTSPGDGICAMWRRRCDVECCVFLYVSTYSTARGVVPGHERAAIRMEVDSAMSETTVDDLAARVKPLLTEAEYIAMHINNRLVSMQCAGEVAETLGAMLYNASQRVRAKRLSLVRSPGAPPAPDAP